MISFLAVKNKKGLTLIEIVVVLLILGGVIAGFLRINAASFSLLEQISNSVIALNDARSVIENMRNIDPFTAANLTSLYPDGANVASFDNLGQEKVIVNYLNTGSDPIQVTVSVSWEGRAGQVFTEQLTTLLTAR